MFPICAASTNCPKTVQFLVVQSAPFRQCDSVDLHATEASFHFGEQVWVQ